MTSAAVHGAPGSLDATFGSGGKVTTPVGASSDIAWSATLQPDGKILTVGRAQISANVNSVAIVRYNSNGTLDTTFNTSGLKTLTFGGIDDQGRGVGLQSNGRIILGAAVGVSGGGYDFGIARLNTDGSLDTTFGPAGSNGIVTLNFGTRPSTPSALVIQSGDKILVAGTTTFGGQNRAAVARFNSDGSLDSGFGAGGMATLPGVIGWTASSLSSVIVQADGKIVMGGSATISGANQFLVARYNANGTADSTFAGASGSATSLVGGGGSVSAVALDNQGRIVAIGSATQSSVSQFAVARFNTDGSLDASFGLSGKAFAGIGSSDTASAGFIDAYGKIVAVGYTSITGANRFAVARFNTNGILDVTFGTNGIVTTVVTPGGIDDHPMAAVLQPDNRIIAAGTSQTGSSYDFAVVRYQNNPVGTTYTWTGDVSSDWSTPDNWNPSAVPGGLDTAIINSGTVDVSANTSVGNVVLNGGTLSGGILTISNSFTWSDGQLSGATVNLAAGSALNLTGPNSKDLDNASTMNNSGTVVWDGTGALRLLGGSTFNNLSGALFLVQNNVTMSTDSSGTFSNRSGAIFRKSNASGTLTVDTGLDFANNGTVDVQTGTLQFNSHNSGNGSYNAGASTVISFNADSVFGSGTAFTGAGINQLNGAGYTLTGAISTSNLQFIGGTLQGTFTETGTLGWTSGSVQNNAAITVPFGSTLNVSGSTQKLMVSGAINNSGTVNWSGTGQFTFQNGSTFSNLSGGLFLAQNDAIFAIDVDCSFNNQAGAIFRKSAGTGLTTISGGGPSFNNNGTVNAQSGTIAFGTQNSGNGAYLASAGALITFSADCTFASGTVMGGGGPLRLLDGTHTLSGTLFATNLEFIGVTLQGSFTNVGSLTWSGGSLGTRLVAASMLNAAGSTLTVNGAATKDLRTYTINNAGTIILTNAGTMILRDGSGINNQTNGLFLVQDDAALTDDGGGFFNNLVGAVFRKSVTTGFTSVSIGIIFVNYGTIELQTGALTFEDDYDSVPGNIVNIVFSGPTPLTQFGQLLVTNQAQLTGTLRIVLSNGYVPAPGSIFTVVTYGTPLGTFASITNRSVGNGIFFDPIYFPKSLALIVRDGTPTIITSTNTLGFTNKDFGFRMLGTDGQTYMIQASTNLTNWASLLTNTLIGTNLDFVDTNAASFSRRFYRALFLSP